MKKTIRDYDLRGKKVIIRVDFNVPIKEGIITDDTRIKRAIPTIKYAVSHGARVILLSHLGKIKERDDLEKNNLYPVFRRLAELLSTKVFFVDKTRGVEVEGKVDNLKDGEVLLLQNTRYEDLEGKKESSCDASLASYWASLGDIFINDAYGTCHRAHASNVGIARLLPNGIGFLVEEEILKLDEMLKEDTHPFVVIMGGAKVHDKIKVIRNLIQTCDTLLIGGGMAYTFLAASNYPIGKSLVDSESFSFCREILENYKDKIVLPIDHLVSGSISSDSVSLKRINDTTELDMGFDIGPATVLLFQDKLRDAKRVIMNGPMGCFENNHYQEGTKGILDFLAENHIKTLIGGGDSAACVNQLSDVKKFYHVSTGGGATLEYLEGDVLPGIGVIDEKE